MYTVYRLNHEPTCIRADNIHRARTLALRLFADAVRVVAYE